MDGNVALFSHGQFGAVLGARWIGLPVFEAQHFEVGPASMSVLGGDRDHPEIPVLALWNAVPRPDLQEVPVL
jgi:probable phosphoglycerate mutase